jgi:protein SCO1/2
MMRTALASALFALLALASAAWLTHGFRVWTAEGARRLELALEPVAAPAVDVVVAGDGPRSLPQLLRADGVVTIVDFVYTHCRSACAALGTGFQQLQARIRADEATRAAGAAGPIRLLSISFDRERDDPATLARYASALDARPGTWRFAAVPDAAQLAALLRQFQVVVIPDALGGYEHNAALLVIDPNARLVRIFDYARIDDAWHFARALAAGAVRP